MTHLKVTWLIAIKTRMSRSTKYLQMKHILFVRENTACKHGKDDKQNIENLTGTPGK